VVKSLLLRRQVGLRIAAHKHRPDFFPVLNTIIVDTLQGIGGLRKLRPKHIYLGQQLRRALSVLFKVGEEILPTVLVAQGKFPARGVASYRESESSRRSNERVRFHRRRWHAVFHETADTAFAPRGISVAEHDEFTQDSALPVFHGHSAAHPRKDY